MSPSAYSRPEPINLSNVRGKSEDEEELQVGEQLRVILRRYTCGNTKLIRPVPIAQAAPDPYGSNTRQ